jgi:hypothetical protein
MLFASERRPIIRMKNPKVKYEDLGRMVRAEWDALSPDERLEYNTIARVDKSTYEQKSANLATIKLQLNEADGLEIQGLANKIHDLSERTKHVKIQAPNYYGDINERDVACFKVVVESEIPYSKTLDSGITRAVQSCHRGYVNLECHFEHDGSTHVMYICDNPCAVGDLVDKIAILEKLLADVEAELTTEKMKEMLHVG